MFGTLGEMSLPFPCGTQTINYASVVFPNDDLVFRQLLKEFDSNYSVFISLYAIIATVQCPCF